MGPCLAKLDAAPLAALGAGLPTVASVAGPCVAPAESAMGPFGVAAGPPQDPGTLRARVGVGPTIVGRHRRVDGPSAATRHRGHPSGVSWALRAEGHVGKAGSKGCAATGRAGRGRRAVTVAAGLNHAGHLTCPRTAQTTSTPGQPLQRRPHGRGAVAGPSLSLVPRPLADALWVALLVPRPLGAAS